MQVQGSVAGGSKPMTISGTGAAAGATGALENVSGINSYTGLLALGATSTISSDSGALSLTNIGTINGAGANLTLTGAGNGSIAGIIGTVGGTLTKTGAGTWVLSGANTFIGATLHQRGHHQLSERNRVQRQRRHHGCPGSSVAGPGRHCRRRQALPSPHGAVAGATGALENVNGINSYAGLLALTASATISSDSGTLNLTNTGTITGAAANLTLAGAGNGSIAGIIGTTTGSLTMNASGLWSFGGASTYSGAPS